jgi:hypothetical protein
MMDHGSYHGRTLMIRTLPPLSVHPPSSAPRADSKRVTSFDAKDEVVIIKCLFDVFDITIEDHP